MTGGLGALRGLEAESPPLFPVKLTGFASIEVTTCDKSGVDMSTPVLPAVMPLTQSWTLMIQCNPIWMFTTYSQSNQIHKYLLVLNRTRQLYVCATNHSNADI